MLVHVNPHEYTYICNSTHITHILYVYALGALGALLRFEDFFIVHHVDTIQDSTGINKSMTIHCTHLMFYPFCRSFWKWSVIILCFPEVVTLLESGDLYSGVWIDFATSSYHQQCRYHPSSQHKLLQF